jgi:hypothetical protein
MACKRRCLAVLETVKHHMINVREGHKVLRDPSKNNGSVVGRVVTRCHALQDQQVRVFDMKRVQSNG